MKKLTDKEILDWLDAQTVELYSWRIEQKQFTFINNVCSTSCEEKRGQTFREAISGYIIRNEKTN